MMLGGGKILQLPPSLKHSQAINHHAYYNIIISLVIISDSVDKTV